MESTSSSSPDSSSDFTQMLTKPRDPQKFNGAEAFGNALSLFFKYPIKFLAIFIIPAIIWEFLSGIYTIYAFRLFQSGQFPSLASEIGLIFGGIILSFVLQVLSTGATAIAAQQGMAGSSPSVFQAFSGTLKRLPALLFLSCIFYAATIVYLFLLGFAISLSGTSFGGALLITLLVTVLFCYLVFRWLVAIPACVLEGRSPLESLSRSALLTAGNKLKILGFYIGLAILLGIAETIVIAIASFAGVYVTLIISVLYGAIATSIIAIAAITVFFELRRAKEYTPPLAAPGKSEEKSITPEPQG